ncbi:CDP-archaeol synthase [Candidatus Peregrinibacteria bacterium]|nr:CDP-archaeol synthase [Candidatus Peregrinibacteria bacterium]
MDYFIEIIGSFLLPAYIANMMPVVAGRADILPEAKMPIDEGRKLFGKRIFGKSKTWRGLFLGIMGGMLGALIWQVICLLTYNESLLTAIRLIQMGAFLDLLNIIFEKIILLGAVIGFGALLGDLVKSFFKRRMNIGSGKPWPIFDQLDFIVGAWLFWMATIVIFKLEIPAVVFLPVLGWSLLITLPIHFLSNVLAYLMGLKKVWW